MSDVFLLPIDRVKPSDETDAFMTSGYRKLVIKMLEINLRDLMSKDATLAAEARAWFDPVAGKNASISFEDCMHVMGWASYVERARKMALENPAHFLSKIEWASHSLTREGVRIERERRADESESNESADHQSNDFFALQRAMFAPS